MTFAEFKGSLRQEHPPGQISRPLAALWHDAKGDWNSAHEIAQEVDTPEAAWVHAYLHRKEGDQSNASYWYHRARQTKPASSLEEEWEAIAKKLC